MADPRNLTPAGGETPASQPWRVPVEQARELAKQRFRDRLANGEQVGGCSCSEDEPVRDEETAPVVGVRFRDSGRVFFFHAPDVDVDTGTWVVAQTSRGEEAGRVVITPRQMMLSQLDGDLKPINRILDEDDVALIDQRRQDAARVVRFGGQVSRAEDMAIKVVAAEFSLDGSRLTVSYSAQDHEWVDELRDAIELEFNTDVEMRSVNAREEARLIGGLGKCGRTLCCSSWLPIYPEVSTGMARNQDLSLNPGKVTGLCGRLLCCLSYENEQYKKARQILPRLGQKVATPQGDGIVVSMQILKELVTVRLDASGNDVTLPASDLPGVGAGQQQRERDTRSTEDGRSDQPPRRRRRRRNRNRPKQES